MVEVHQRGALQVARLPVVEGQRLQAVVPIHEGRAHVAPRLRHAFQPVVAVVAGRQLAWRVEELERVLDHGANRVRVDVPRLARGRQVLLKLVDPLLGQEVRPKLLAHLGARLLVDRDGASPPQHVLLDALGDDVANAAEVLPHLRDLLDGQAQHVAVAVVLVVEVQAPHLLRGLPMPVDAAVALLHPHGVPGDLVVDEVAAVRLEVEPLAGGIGGEQDAHRVGLVVDRLEERVLDPRSLAVCHAAVEELDVLLVPVRDQHLVQVLQRVLVLREDQQPLLVPLSRRA